MVRPLIAAMTKAVQTLGIIFDPVLQMELEGLAWKRRECQRQLP